jgi:hypothetical protein
MCCSDSRHTGSRSVTPNPDDKLSEHHGVGVPPIDQSGAKVQRDSNALWSDGLSALNTNREMHAFRTQGCQSRQQR